MKNSTGWQKLWEGTKGLRQKVWTLTKISNPNIRYLVAILWFVGIYAIFGRIWAIKCSFWSKTVFLGQKVPYYMVHIAFHTELNLQICNYAQKQQIFFAKIANNRLTKILWPFLRSPKGCHPGVWDHVSSFFSLGHKLRKW